MIKANSSDEIMEYENSILETKYPEFGEYINEFKEDVLVFDISETKLWNKINKDTTQLYNYYEQKKNEYMSPRSLMAKIYTYKKKGGEKTLWKVYKKNANKVNCDDILKEKLDPITIEDGEWYEGENAVLDRIDWKRGTERTTIDGYPAIIKISLVRAPKPLTYEDIKEELMDRFAEETYNSWIEQLNRQYNVMINDAVLKEMKDQL